MSDSKSGANHYLYGRTHTPESKAQMSDSKSGANNPMYGRTGALHPRFGITPTHALTVNVYSAVDNQLVRSFSSSREGLSRVACAKWLDVSNKTVRNYIKSGQAKFGWINILFETQLLANNLAPSSFLSFLVLLLSGLMIPPHQA